MDLRSLPSGLSASERCDERRRMIENELGVDLTALSADAEKLGHAEERNCEQMFGHVPIPVGLAGPLAITFENGEKTNVHLPLATTEAALVASINRGCKALSLCGSVQTKSTYHGMTRSIAFRVPKNGGRSFLLELHAKEDGWKAAGEATSSHLKILSHVVDVIDDHVFLTIACDTDEAMGMNMTTIAAAAIGQWIAEHCGVTFVTVAANIDSDKKPSTRTHDKGRGYEVEATTTLTPDVIASVLKTTPDALLATAHAKLELGSQIAGAIGSNLHAANVIAALYLALGQDAAHVVEGSLTDTTLEAVPEGLRVSVRCPAILIGVRGGGTTLPAQSQALALLLNPKTSLHPCKQLAETIGAGVLAGEISLLAAQASHTLAVAHQELARGSF